MWGASAHAQMIKSNFLSFKLLDLLCIIWQNKDFISLTNFLLVKTDKMVLTTMVYSRYMRSLGQWIRILLWVLQLLRTVVKIHTVPYRTVPHICCPVVLLLSWNEVALSSALIGQEAVFIRFVWPHASYRCPAHIVHVNYIPIAHDNSVQH